MSAATKTISDLARQFYKLSFDQGALSSERVAGVLEYIEKHVGRHQMAVLHAYHRLIATEVARGQALVEYAGPVSDATLNGIAASLGRKYGRTVTTVTQANPALIAGLRVRIGDDIYESSVSGQLAELATSV